MTTQLALFDYGSLDSETRIVVQQRTSEIKSLMRRAAQDIIDIGHKLIEVQGAIGYGAFDGWLSAEFNWSRRTAFNFIAVAERFGSANFAQLDIAASALYLLAAPSTPEPARLEAIERAEAGETITYSAAREIVADHRAPAIEPPLPFSEPIERSADDYADPYGDDEPGVWSAPPLASHQRINLSTSNEWYTPGRFVEAAREVMGGIDLDPASCEYANRTVRAAVFYTQADDGYAQPWTGRVWMNPPYGREEGESDGNQARWTRRLVDEYRAGNVSQAVMLVNAVPGNLWFTPLKDFPICFPDGRIRFYNEETEAGQPTHSNALVYLGRNVAAFVRVFSQFGRVMGPLVVEGNDVRAAL